MCGTDPGELSPFQGGLFIGWFPGLKRWAEPHSPFGAQNHPEPPLSSRHSDLSPTSGALASVICGICEICGYLLSSVLG